MSLSASAVHQRAADLELLTSSNGLLGVNSPLAQSPLDLSRDRDEIHQQVLDQLRHQDTAIPTGGRLYLATGGLPGAGKSTITPRVARHVFGDQRHAVVDPDSIRDALLTQVLDRDGQHPALRGHPDLALAGGPPCPRELSTALHAEASYLANLHRDWLLATGRNFVNDASMQHLSSTRDLADRAHAAGYTVHAAYVDVGYVDARARADVRWATGVDRHEPTAPPGSEEWLGGRYLPDWYLRSSFPGSISDSPINRQTFDRLANSTTFDTAVLYDGRHSPARLTSRWNHGHPVPMANPHRSQHHPQPPKSRLDRGPEL